MRFRYKHKMFVRKRLSKSLSSKYTDTQRNIISGHNTKIFCDEKYYHTKTNAQYGDSLSHRFCCLIQIWPKGRPTLFGLLLKLLLFASVLAWCSAIHLCLYLASSLSPWEVSSPCLCLFLLFSQRVPSDERTPARVAQSCPSVPLPVSSPGRSQHLGHQ